MKRRIPIVPTVIVLAAVAVMLSLGVWQWGRADWKAGLLDRYASAGGEAPVSFPTASADVEPALYRRTTVTCERVLESSALAGKNQAGTVGWAQTAKCELAGGGEADLVLGWSIQPDAQAGFVGGEVSGIIGPGRDGMARLIADPPIAPLQANAAPDPSDIPNNHLSYAFQWFFFALTALVIYGLALRKRWRG